MTDATPTMAGLTAAAGAARPGAAPLGDHWSSSESHGSGSSNVCPSMAPAARKRVVDFGTYEHGATTISRRPGEHSPP